MTTRLLSTALLALLVTGCTWEDRPDGAEAVRTTGDGFYESDAAPQSTPLSGIPTEVEVVEPLDGAETPTDAPVDLSQPAPTTGTADNTSEVEEALTPGTEQ